MTRGRQDVIILDLAERFLNWDQKGRYSNRQFCLYMYLKDLSRLSGQASCLNYRFIEPL